MIADNFELEPPHHDDQHVRPIQEVPSTSLDNDFTSANDELDGKGLAEPLLLDREEEHVISDRTARSKDDAKLLFSFFLMLIVGTLNKIFQKLQAIVSIYLLTIKLPFVTYGI